jgi:hypothetical protein
MDQFEAASLSPLQVEVRVHRLVLHHERPILGVMVGVDDGEHRMVHVVLRAPADVLELKLDRLAGDIFPVMRGRFPASQ